MYDKFKSPPFLVGKDHQDINNRNQKLVLDHEFSETIFACKQLIEENEQFFNDNCRKFFKDKTEEIANYNSSSDEFQNPTMNLNGVFNKLQLVNNHTKCRYQTSHTQQVDLVDKEFFKDIQDGANENMAAKFDLSISSKAKNVSKPFVNCTRAPLLPLISNPKTSHSFQNKAQWGDVSKTYESDDTLFDNLDLRDEQQEFVIQIDNIKELPTLDVGALIATTLENASNRDFPSLNKVKENLIKSKFGIISQSDSSSSSEETLKVFQTIQEDQQLEINEAREVKKVSSKCSVNKKEEVKKNEEVKRKKNLQKKFPKKPKKLETGSDRSLCRTGSKNTNLKSTLLKSQTLANSRNSITKVINMPKICVISEITKKSNPVKVSQAHAKSSIETSNRIEKSTKKNLNPKKNLSAIKTNSELNKNNTNDKKIKLVNKTKVASSSAASPSKSFGVSRASSVSLKSRKLSKTKINIESLPPASTTCSSTKTSEAKERKVKKSSQVEGNSEVETENEFSSELLSTDKINSLTKPSTGENDKNDELNNLNVKNRSMENTEINENHEYENYRVKSATGQPLIQSKSAFKNRKLGVKRKESKSPVAPCMPTTPTRSHKNLDSFNSLKKRKSSIISKSSSYRSSINRTSLSRLSKDFVARNMTNPLTVLRNEVNHCIRLKKTFTVQGRFPGTRKALLDRGWVEKFHPSHRQRVADEFSRLDVYSVDELVHLLSNKSVSDVCKKLIKSKLLADHQVDLYWGTNYEAFKINSDRVKLTLINKFRRDLFSYTSKQGLSEAAKDSHWFNFPGVAKINHPRAYSLAKNGDIKSFVEDFHRNAAVSLLKWVKNTAETKVCKIISPAGKVPIEVFYFAVNECCKYIKTINNEDIDIEIKPAMEHEWHQFLQYFYKIVHTGNHFKECKGECTELITKKAEFLLSNIERHSPSFSLDGMMNIWIVKPSAGSRGQGIHICRTLQYILQIVKTNPNVRYIIQKYIERPLLIFNTKFDIRQWFLISCASPLTIWMYKDCYLRFSSQTYNLRKLHESIHLTNNSIQCRYRHNLHDITLPKYNMWDSVQFMNHLSNIGYPEVYKEVIYKGMKEGIIAAVLIHQDKFDKRKNCFEIYGADFMIAEDFQPWLIEINSSPALHASTPVTAKMCPQVQEDIIKVVIDFARNKQASTGRFELVYKQNISQKKVSNIQLKLSGSPVPENYFDNHDNCYQETNVYHDIRTSEQQYAKELERTQKSGSHLELISKSMKHTLESLLKFIQKQGSKTSTSSITKDTKSTVATATSQNGQLGVPKISCCTVTSSTLMNAEIVLEQTISDINDAQLTDHESEMIEEAFNLLKKKKKKSSLKHILHTIRRILNKKEKCL